MVDCIQDIFSSFEIIPKKNMTKEEKVNTLTRLLLVVLLVMLIAKVDNQYVLYTLVIGIVIIIVANNASRNNGNEGFTLTPYYTGQTFNQTTVAPLHAEEWQVPPPAYDHIVNHSGCDDIQDSYEEIPPQSYPYGQYLTRTNQLPGDERHIHLNSNGGHLQAREFANSYYVRNDLAFRDNMTKIYKKSLQRRFKHNTADVYSPYNGN